MSTFIMQRKGTVLGNKTLGLEVCIVWLISSVMVRVALVLPHANLTTIKLEEPTGVVMVECHLLFAVLAEYLGVSTRDDDQGRSA